MPDAIPTFGIEHGVCFRSCSGHRIDQVYELMISICDVFAHSISAKAQVKKREGSSIAPGEGPVSGTWIEDI